jgi:hypothetical protein
MHIEWEQDYLIKVGVRDGEVTISANREGLLSLSRIFADLAEEKPGTHIHLDEYNSLEEGSTELIVERLE